MARKLSYLDQRRVRRAIEKLSRSGGGDLSALGAKSRRAIRKATGGAAANRVAKDLGKVAAAITGSGKDKFSGRKMSREAIRQMSRLPELGPLGRMIGDIEKYASGRGGGLKAFINRMGPIGSLFQAVVGAIRGGGGVTEADLVSAARLLTSAGYSVTDSVSSGLAGMASGMAGGGAGATTAAPPRSPASPQIQFSPSTTPPGVPPNRSRPGPQPTPPHPPGESEPIFAPGSYQTNAPPLPGQESPFSHEILTPQSSNVFSFTYDPQTSTLYVTYKAHGLHAGQVKVGGGRLGGQRQLRGRIGHTVSGKTNERGPMYAYYDVPQRVFRRMELASSKGRFVWDELRVRGTIYGSRYRYSLAQGQVTLPRFGGGVSGVYIPRRATQQGFRVRSVAVIGTGRRAFQSSTLPGQSGHSTRRR